MIAAALTVVALILPVHTAGAIDPAVTQANLDRTVCVHGYTSTVRPPVAYTNWLKEQQLAAWRYPSTDPGLYEEDHYIPLALGGSPRSPQNLWPEPRTQSAVSDPYELRLWLRMCRHEITLTTARTLIRRCKRTYRVPGCDIELAAKPQEGAGQSNS